MKKAIVFSIITLGISSVITQLLIIRELIISFYGNEFFIGWIFLSWLFWVGIGSLFLNKIFTNKISQVLIGSHLFIALLLPLEIFLTRFSRTFIAGPAGQIPNLLPSLLYTFVILAPLCLLLGLQFAIVSRFWKSINQEINLSQILGKTYVLETLGFIIGGLAFSYILIFINEFQTVSILAWLNLLAAGFVLILIKQKNYFLKSLVIILIIAFIGILISSKNINNQTNSLRFPNQKLIESKNSIYGNIAVSKIKNQYNFYESGLFLGADKEEIFNEYIHIPLLYHPHPKNILLIGNGFNGIIKEILKHNPAEIFYLELDPNLIEITKNYLSQDLGKYLEDNRVQIVTTDARYFIKNTSENFDVIIINLPNPSTALINRFYTDEFFKEAKNHLKKQGILTIYLLSSANYFGTEVENLDTSLYRALKNNFDSILILPEDQHLFIASQNQLDYNPESLIQKFKQRNIKTNFVNEEYIKYRLTNDRIGLLNNLLAKNKTAKTNQDQLPISYYYNFVYWVSSFYPKLAKFFQSLGKINFIWVIIFFTLGSILVLFFSRVLSPKAGMDVAEGDRAKGSTLSEPRRGSRGKRENNTRKLLPFVMVIAGFSLMAAEMIIIFGFQVFYGYLYYKIALIITVLMVGMALGSWMGTKKINQAKIKTLIKIHLLIILFSLILFSIFYFLFKTSPKPSVIIEIIFLIFAALIGGLVAFEFPIVNKLYLLKNDTPKRAGVIYGADLIGSCLGASLFSIFFVPIFGIFQALIILLVLNILIIISLFYSKSTS